MSSISFQTLGLSSHRSYSEKGVKLLIIDGDFFK